MSLPRFEGYEPAHLSFSTLNSYRMCGEQMRLQKIDKAEQRPGLAGIGGNAVHAGTEYLDLADFFGLEVDIQAIEEGS